MVCGREREGTGREGGREEERKGGSEKGIRNKTRRPKKKGQHRLREMGMIQRRGFRSKIKRVTEKRRELTKLQEK